MLVLWGLFKMGINNFSNINTTLVSEDWINKKRENNERIESIYKVLKSYTAYKNYKIFSATKNGQIVVRIQHLIPINMRSVIFWLNLKKFVALGDFTLGKPLHDFKLNSVIF